MRLLAIDIGTGTQDILIFDTERQPENCFKMVIPSPTVMVAERIRQATARGAPLLLSGVTMGGGPCAWAAEAHLEAGHTVFATPYAARTFNDDLDEVKAIGVRLVNEDEANRLTGVERVVMRDLDVQAIRQALAHLGVPGDFDALAVAVFDHGNAPPGYSDRQFRFDYLAERLEARNHLTTFAFWRDQVPASMTRLLAVVHSAPDDIPLFVMDTAPAAVLGALEDPRVAAQRFCIVANVGNFHTLAFRLCEGHIEGLFEHHTGRLTRDKVEKLLCQLAEGTLSHEALFADHGHGALLLNRNPIPLGFLAVTGPRRGLLKGSHHQPYMAVPYGDMMLAGCWGMIRALAESWPEHREEIEAALETGI
ncbi:MAG: DUF1786 domain-containing protein [Chloroflexota bacterium]